MFEESNDYRKKISDDIHKVLRGNIEKASKWNIGDTNVFKGRLCQVVRFNDKGRPVWRIIDKKKVEPKIEKQVKKEEPEVSVAVSQDDTVDEKFGRYLEQELKDDYGILEDSYDNGLKKKMAEKYNIDTKKTAEIQKQILLGIQEKRNQKTREQLTVEDLNWWNRLYPNTDTYNGLKAALRDESEAFIDLLMEKYREGKEKAESKAYYGYSSWDKLRISRYKNIVRYLNEKKNAADEGLQGLIKSLTTQTQDLKDRYLEQIRVYSEVRWEANREWVAKTRKKIEDLRAGKDYDALSKEVLDEIGRLRMYLNRHAITVSKEHYVEDRVKIARKNFEQDIRVIAERVRQKGIDESKIKTKPFSKDNTGIDMLIGDENRGLWARGILAAEYSEKVSPHYRFIVTEKNDGSYRVR